MPKVGFNIHFQAVPVTMNDSAIGYKYIVLKRPSALIFWSRNIARIIPITIQIIKKSAVKISKLSTAISHFLDAHNLTYWPTPQSSYFGRIFEFVNEIVGGVIPKEYIPAVEKGVVEQMENGIIAGYPVVDVRVTLHDGSYHDVDSSEMAFKIAGSMGFKEGASKAKPVLLEPVMKVEIVTPEEYLGTVNGDLNRRRGILQGTEETPAGKVIRAEVPLSEMFGYATDLRSATQGRAVYTMEFEKYNEVPANIAESITSKN